MNKAILLNLMVAIATLSALSRCVNADIVNIESTSRFSGGQSSQAIVDAGVDRIEFSGQFNTQDLVLIDSGNFTNENGFLDFHEYTTVAPFTLEIYGNPLQYGNDNTLIASIDAQNLNFLVTRSNSIYSIRTRFDDPTFQSFVPELDSIIARDLISGADDFSFSGAIDSDIATFIKNAVSGEWNIEGADVSFDFDDNAGGHNANISTVPRGTYTVTITPVPEPDVHFIALLVLAALVTGRRQNLRTPTGVAG